MLSGKTWSEMMLTLPILRHRSVSGESRRPESSNAFVTVARRLLPGSSIQTLPALVAIPLFLALSTSSAETSPFLRQVQDQKILEKAKTGPPNSVDTVRNRQLWEIAAPEIEVRSGFSRFHQAGGGGALARKGEHRRPHDAADVWHRKNKSV